MSPCHCKPDITHLQSTPLTYMNPAHMGARAGPAIGLDEDVSTASAELTRKDFATTYIKLKIAIASPI